MKLSNTLYFNQATVSSDTPSLSLTPSDIHTVEYMNEPMVGYHSPRKNKGSIYLTHPTLNLEFKMLESEYVEMTFKVHWPDARLIISDDGKLHEFNPETMAVEQRVPVERYEHRLVCRKGEKPSNYEASWVDKLNHKTRRATMLTLNHGHFSKATVSFNELQASWSILEGTPSSQTLDTWRESIHDRVAWLTAPRAPAWLSFKEQGLTVNASNFCCSALATAVEEANQQGKPILMALSDDDYRMPIVRTCELSTAMPDFQISSSSRMLIPTSVLSKQLDTLPIEGYSGWESAVVAQEKALKLQMGKGYRLDVAHETAKLISKVKTTTILTKLCGEFTWVTTQVLSGVDTFGQFFLRRKLEIYRSRPMSYDQQVSVIQALKDRFISTESYELATEPQPEVELKILRVSSCISCGSSPQAIEAKHQELLEALDGYVVLSLRYGFPYVLRQQTSEDQISFSYPLLKLALDYTSDSVRAAVEAYLSRTT